MKNLSNKVNLIGNLGNDPELVQLESGRSLTKFSIATSSSYKNADGEQVKDTQWHNIIAWGKTAEIAAKYLKKGSRVALEGKLSNRKYTAKDGNDRYITEIIINELMMLGN